MLRAAQEKSRAKRVQKMHLYLNHRREVVVKCICDVQVNRFRKGQRARGCGNPRCFLCHSDKLNKEPKLRDLKQLARERDDEQVIGDDTI